MQLIDGIRMGLLSVRQEGNKVGTVDLEDLAEHVPFRLGHRLELFHPLDAVVPVNGFRHEGFQRSGLPVKVDHTFLDVGPLFSEFVV